MPYHAAKSGKCPTSKPWACIKTGTGEVMGCHTSKHDAQRQVAALYANEPGMKSADVERTFNPDEPRDPHTGKWIGVGSALESAADSIRKVLQDAKTTQQLEKAAKDEVRRITGRDCNVLLDGTSPATSREHVEGILRGLERFPHVKLTFISRTPNADAYAEALDAYGDGRDVRIFFSTKYTTPNARKSYLRSLRKDEDHHWTSNGGGTPMGTALHEFGHAVAFSADDGMLLANAELLLRRKAKEQGGSPSAAAWQVSFYAATDQHELIAEAFADVMVNGDGASPMSREVFGQLVEAYDRKFGGAG